MSNKIWSTYLQAPDTLYKSRKLRFRDEYKEPYLKALGLKDGMDILEIGCGPGLLTHKIAEWLPESNITGLDRDENFIRYSKDKSKELHLPCEYVQGDALTLPFFNNSFDACTSHTVIEHVPTMTFLKEQYRVCRKGGVVSVMSSRTEAAINPEDWFPPTGEEQELWSRVEEAARECQEKHRVGKHNLTVSDIPRHMEEAGFVDVNVDFIAVTSVPDNPHYSMAQRKEFIESNRQIALDGVILAQNYAPGAWNDEEVERLRTLINQRFDARIEKLLEAKNIWDISVSMLMITRGYKK